MLGLFITGTDTDVGKTFVTALIARELVDRGHRVGIYKPVCSGAERSSEGTLVWSDIETHFSALGEKYPRHQICPQCFEAPAAPPVAAQVENRQVNRAMCSSGVSAWLPQVEILLIEGVGGFLCPLTQQESIADFAVELGVPVLLVARASLGTLNHTLLTLEAIQHRGLQAAGVILNESQPPAKTLSEKTNLEELAIRTRTPILSLVQYAQSAWLQPCSGARTIDWFALAGKLSTSFD